MADSDLGTVEKWIRARLIGDSTLMTLVGGVYAYEAPRGATGVVVTFEPSSMEDQMAMGGHRIGSSYRFIVKGSVVGQGMMSVDAVAERIDHLLHRSWDGDVLGTGKQIAITRLGQVAYTEVDQGVRYFHRGATFEVFFGN